MQFCMLFIWRISGFIHIYFLVVISMGHDTFFSPSFQNIWRMYFFRYIYIALNPLSDFVFNGDESLNFNCNNFYSNRNCKFRLWNDKKYFSNNDNRTFYVFPGCFFFFFFYFVLFNITPFRGTMFVFPWVYWVQFIRSFRACLCPIFVSRGKQYFTDK